MADAGVVASFCDHWIISGEGQRLAQATDENSRVTGGRRFRTDAWLIPSRSRSPRP